MSIAVPSLSVSHHCRSFPSKFENTRLQVFARLDSNDLADDVTPGELGNMSIRIHPEAASTHIDLADHGMGNDVRCAERSVLPAGTDAIQYAGG